MEPRASRPAAATRLGDCGIRRGHPAPAWGTRQQARGSDPARGRRHTPRPSPTKGRGEGALWLQNGGIISHFFKALSGLIIFKLFLQMESSREKRPTLLDQDLVARVRDSLAALKVSAAAQAGNAAAGSCWRRTRRSPRKSSHSTAFTRPLLRSATVGGSISLTISSFPSS